MTSEIRPPTVSPVQLAAEEAARIAADDGLDSRLDLIEAGAYDEIVTSTVIADLPAYIATVPTDSPGTGHLFGDGSIWSLKTGGVPTVQADWIQVRRPSSEEVTQAQLKVVSDATTTVAYGNASVALTPVVANFSNNTLALNSIQSSINVINYGANTAGSIEFTSLEKMHSIANTANLVSFANNLMTGLSFPAIKEFRSDTNSFYGFNTTNCTLLSSVVINTGLKKMHGASSAISLPFKCSGCAFSLTTIANILAVCAAMDGTNGTWSWNGTIDVSGGTSAGHSTWTAQMLADETAITARGGAVTSNT